jgi:hypothetical protein
VLAFTKRGEHPCLARLDRLRARLDAGQRLQIGGGALAVAVIWTLALWPSGDNTMEGQSGPVPAVSPTPWTTGPFVGTAQTTSPGLVRSSNTTTAPTAGASTAPPTPGTRYTPPPGPAAPAPTSSPKATSTTSDDAWTPPGQVNKTTRPPKALSLTDVLDIS